MSYIVLPRKCTNVQDMNRCRWRGKAAPPCPDSVREFPRISFMRLSGRNLNMTEH